MVWWLATGWSLYGCSRTQECQGRGAELDLTGTPRLFHRLVSVVDLRWSKRSVAWDKQVEHGQHFVLIHWINTCTLEGCPTSEISIVSKFKWFFIVQIFPLPLHQRRHCVLLSYVWVPSRAGSGARHLQIEQINSAKSSISSISSTLFFLVTVEMSWILSMRKVEYEIVPQLNNKKPGDVLNSLDVIEESKAGIPCACANVKWLK